MSERILIVYVSARPHLINGVLKNIFETAGEQVYVYLCYSGEEIHIDKNDFLVVVF